MTARPARLHYHEIMRPTPSRSRHAERSSAPAIAVGSLRSSRDAPLTSFRPRWLWWGLVTLGWTIDGWITASQMHGMLTPAGDAIDWGTALLTSLASALLWVPFTLMAFHGAARFPLDRGHIARPLLAHVAGAALVSLLRALAVVLLNPFVGWYDTLPPAGELLLTSLRNNVLVYFLLVGIGHAVYYARTARLQRAQLEEARLHVLESQLQPHFLFNALNTIVAHIRTSPSTAERIIEQLSLLLRNSLESASTHEVPLEHELHMLTPYIEIEQARFEDRLTIHQEIASDVRTALVPHLILQPLIENAVRHGLAHRAAPGEVVVRASAERGVLHLAVCDNGAGIPAGARSRESWGIGLRNTADRLAGLYGRDATFELRDATGGGAEVHITLPLRKAAHDDGTPVAPADAFTAPSMSR